MSASPMAIALPLLVLAWVEALAVVNDPRTWPSLSYLPLVLSLWSVGLGIHMGRRWGGALTGVGSEAQRLLAPPTRELRYRAWAHQGLAWSTALWAAPVVPILILLWLLRIRSVAMGPVPAAPIATTWQCGFFRCAFKCPDDTSPAP